MGEAATFSSCFLILGFLVLTGAGFLSFFLMGFLFTGSFFFAIFDVVVIFFLTTFLIFGGGGGTGSGGLTGATSGVGITSVKLIMLAGMLLRSSVEKTPAL